MARQGKVLCTCLAHCGGGKEVSWSTYDRHASARYGTQPLPAASGSGCLQQHIHVQTSNGNRKRPICVAEDSGEGSQGPSKQPRVETTPSIPNTSSLPHSGAGQPSSFDTTGNLEEPQPEEDQTPDGVPASPQRQDLLDFDTIDEPVQDLSLHSMPEPVPSESAPDPGSLDALAVEDTADDAAALPTDGPPPPNMNEDSTLLSPDIHRPTAETSPSTIRDIAWANAFIEALKAASLDASITDPELVHLLRHPTEGVPDVTDKMVRHSIEVFLAVGSASQETYHRVRASTQRCFEDSEMLSYDQVKRRIANLSGVVPVIHDMCVNSCLAFTGPFEQEERCPLCLQPRFDQDKLAASGGTLKVPRQEFHTIPLGPQLQARRRSPEMAKMMQYGALKMAEILKEVDSEGRVQIDVYDDVFHGRDLLDAVIKGIIQPNDTVVMMSIDGAQLYKNKASDTWIYIWILFSLPPDSRYQKAHILPGGFIPGPNKPKNLDSFIFPGLFHLAALQREGLRVWDAASNAVITDRPFLAFATADTPAMALLDGMVGHTGRLGCRFYCPMPGRHKDGRPQYYPACLKPDNYAVAGSDHDDISLRTLASISSTESAARYEANLKSVAGSRTATEYKERRLATGIVKPSIFSGLPRFMGIPAAFPADLMHLVSLNLPDLLISLWRGAIECEATDSKDDWAWRVLVGETWKELGRIIAAIAPYLPGSFDRPPRNPAEKMSSGYKAWEFLLLVFGLFPALLEGILPMIFWKNFCLLVFGIRLLHQRKITKVELLAAHKVLVTFSEDFEVVYYQRRADRLHFCRPSIHQTPHLAPESTRCGPLGLSSQWPMERTIGNLGQEVKQPSNPYANLSQRGLLRGQVNALKGMMPGIEPEPSTIPRGAIELDDEYILLRAKDTCARDVRPSEAECIRQYVRAEGGECEDTYVPQVTRWARLRLPNGQTARSAWKEKIKPLSRVRMARNVKIQSGGTWEIAEVQFYFRLRLHEDDTVRSLALVSIYDPPNAARLAASHGVVWSSVYRGDASLRVVGVKSIRTVVAMIPYNILQHAAALEHARGSLPDHEYFLMEKPGLDIIFMGGVGEDIVDEE